MQALSYAMLNHNAVWLYKDAVCARKCQSLTKTLHCLLYVQRSCSNAGGCCRNSALFLCIYSGISSISQPLHLCLKCDLHSFDLSDMAMRQEKKPIPVRTEIAAMIFSKPGADFINEPEMQELYTPPTATRHDTCVSTGSARHEWSFMTHRLHRLSSFDQCGLLLAPVKPRRCTLQVQGSHPLPMTTRCTSWSSISSFC